MTRVLTRVCTRCRRRKYLREFYERKGTTTGYTSACKACTRRKERIRRHPWRAELEPVGWTPPKFFDCQYCGGHTIRRATNQRTCGSAECQRRLKQDQNKRARTKHGDICRDCGGPAYFSRCEECRAKRQAQIESTLAPATAEQSDICCGMPLEFDSDPMTGRTLQTCAHCGTRPVPIIGVRHYDQRVTLDDEIEGAVERSGRAPDTRYAGLGMHFRQKSNEFTRKSA
jgi:hypothetical protein